MWNKLTLSTTIMETILIIHSYSKLVYLKKKNTHSEKFVDSHAWLSVYTKIKSKQRSKLLSGSSWISLVIIVDIKFIGKGRWTLTTYVKGI